MATADQKRRLRSFRRFFWMHRTLSKLLGKVRWAPSAIGKIGPLLHPGRRVPAYARNWDPRAWGTYLKASCMATALIYRMLDFRSFAQIEWNDPDGALDVLRSEGGVVMSFHHSFAYHLPALLGAQGISFEALALSPEESPLYPLFEQYAASWFSDTEHYFGGGRWRFLYRDKPNNMRQPLKALKEGRAVYSLNDFPNIYEGSKTIPTDFLDTRIDVSEGILGPALRMNKPVVAAYVHWLGGARFAVNLSLLKSTGEPDLSSQALFARYFSLLERIVASEPEFWEAWGNIKPA